jgi:hypothetical protein
MNEDELISQFESGVLPEDSFRHADHVRLAFAYLSLYSTLDALDRFSNSLKRYAAARGKAERYNETITYAYFFLIRERVVRSGARGWDEFAHGNADLLAWRDGVLARYYEEGTLKSDLARRLFLFPDRLSSSVVDSSLDAKKR